MNEGLLLMPSNSTLPQLTSRAALIAARPETASRIRSLAEEPELVLRSSELKALAGAIEAGGEQESAWRGARLIDSFSPERTIGLARSTGGAQLLVVLATVIVFFPIAWTWWGLREALGAYRSILKTGTSETRSFLQLWTQGFDGELPSHLALPEVALGSVVLISLSITLVLLERIQYARQASRQTARSDDLASALSATMLLAEQTLRLNSADTMDEAADLLQDAATAVVASQMSIAASAAELRAIGKDLLSNLTDSYEALEKGTSSAMAELERRMKATSNLLSKGASQAATSLERAVAQVEGTLHQSTDAAVRDLVQVVQGLTAAAEDQTNAAVSTDRASSSLTSAAQQVDASASSISSSLTDLPAQLTAALNPLLAALDGRATELNQHTSTLDKTLLSHTSALQHQISELTQIRAELGRLQATGRQAPLLSPGPAV